MKSLIIKGTILLFLLSNSLSKSKYYLVETADKAKLLTETEIKKDDQQRICHYLLGVSVSVFCITRRDRPKAFT